MNHVAASMLTFFVFSDMINMLKLNFEPGQCEWIYPTGAAIAAVAW